MTDSSDEQGDLLDLSYIRRTFIETGAINILRESIPVFELQCRFHLIRLCDMFHQGDEIEMRQQLHKLQGMSGALGARRLQRLLKRFETAATATENNQANIVLDEMEQAVTQTIEALIRQCACRDAGTGSG